MYVVLLITSGLLILPENILVSPTLITLYTLYYTLWSLDTGSKQGRSFNFMQMKLCNYKHSVKVNHLYVAEVCKFLYQKLDRVLMKIIGCCVHQ